jgi:hypothetical protein
MPSGFFEYISAKEMLVCCPTINFYGPLTLEYEASTFRRKFETEYAVRYCHIPEERNAEFITILMS